MVLSQCIHHPDRTDPGYLGHDGSPLQDSQHSARLGGEEGKVGRAR